MSLTNEHIIERLISLEDLDGPLISELMDRILSETMSKAQIAASLALLRAKKETGLEISESSKAVLKRALPIKRPDYLFADVVGTGGDGHNTINVSTLSSMTAATLGLPIAKHGNASVSSQCGSADVLTELNIDIAITPERSRACLDEHNWCFLYAPIFHPTFKSVKPIRQELKIKTIFNILGPLVNPLSPPIMLIGVYDEKLLDPFAQALKNLGSKKALVVHGSGLDEIALHGATKAILIDDKSLTNFTIEPQSLGLGCFSIEEIKGGHPEKNAADFLEVLSGRSPLAKTSIVAASTGALLWLFGKAKNLEVGAKMAKEALLSGSCLKTLKAIEGFSNGT